MNGVFFTDIVNFVLAVIASIVAAQLVLRTEKSLDKAAKCFLVTALVLFIATLLAINKYFRIISPGTEATIFNLSRTAALVFFIAGNYLLLKITSRE